jgi:hypothetical protein
MIMFSPLYNYFALKPLVTSLFNYKIFKLTLYSLGLIQKFSPQPQGSPSSLLQILSTYSYG